MEKEKIDQPPGMKEECCWSNDDLGGDSVWATTCGRDFYFDGADGPADAGFRWCPFCGKSLEEQRTSEAPEEPESDDARLTNSESGKA